MEIYKGVAVWDGPVMAVNADELNAYTGRGWVLLERFEETDAVAMPHEVPNPRAEDYNYLPTMTVTEVAVVKTSRYLIGQTERDALAAAKDATARAVEAKADAAEGQRIANEALAELEGKHEVLMQSAHALRTQVAQNIGIAREEKELRHKLEADLAKLRKHVGEKTFNEAVNG